MSAGDYHDFVIEDIKFDTIRNRNEKRVLKAMRQVLGQDCHELSRKDIQDIYALTLNKIPAHYVQRGTIVLIPNVSSKDLIEKVHECVEQVRGRAKA